MKKLLLFALIIMPFVTFSQSGGFDKVVEINSGDNELVRKLKDFEKGGIEKTLPLTNVKINDLIDTAKSYLGTPHCMGGTSHQCIDCSGLLFVTFKSFAVAVPHNSQEIARYGKIIPFADSLKRGDLVFFVKTYNTSKVITHAGIYLGNGDFIHTSASHGVVISNLSSDYYKTHFIFGTRVFPQKPNIKPIDKPVKIDNTKEK
jgi:hypothetical protein